MLYVYLPPKPPAGGSPGRTRSSSDGRQRKQRHTWQLLFQVFVVFVSIPIGGDERSGLCVADVLELVAEFFEANPAEIAESSIEGGHAGGIFPERTEMIVEEWLCRYR